MSATKRQILSGWGHCPVAECNVYRPEKKRELTRILSEQDGPMIARGLGRSYGDASLQKNAVIRTERLNHFIEFDTVTGVVHAQAGVTLAEVMELTIPQGWLPPVIPGTRLVTLGGAFACNVHGKNHFIEGDFAEHVTSIRLTIANGDTIECTPGKHGDLFWATAGGMGMTGIIEEVTLKLKPIASTSLKTVSYRVDSAEDMLAAFEHYRHNTDYMVGWIDHMGKGAELGRGVFEGACHIPPVEGGGDLAGYVATKTRFNVPFFAPSLLLNRYSMAAYNKWHFRKYSSARQLRVVGFDGFFHPLDRVGQWNRLYGKRGFYQYQCVIPESADTVKHIRTFLAAIHHHKLFSFLAVIKYHRAGKGFLTFPVQGYSIALDFPNTARVRALLPQLDRWVAENGGRTYLAKDALLSPELFRMMYGERAVQWNEIVREIDPSSRFASRMSERLRWKSGS